MAKYISILVMLLYVVMLPPVYSKVGDAVFIFSIVPLIVLLWSFNLYVSLFGQLLIMVETFIFFQHLNIENTFINEAHLSGLVLNILILLFVYVAKLRLTKAKRAATTLANEQAYLEAMVTNITDVILVLNEKGIIKYVSKNIYKQFGITQEEAIGQKVWKWIYAEDVDEAVNAFGDLLMNREYSGKFAYRMVVDNRVSYVRLSAKNMLNDGVVNGILINFRDYTTQMEDRNALHTSEYRYRTLYDSIKEVVCVVDGDKKIIDINKSGCRILGLDKIDLLERDFLSFVHTEDLNKVVVLFERESEMCCNKGVVARIIAESNNLFWGEIFTARYMKDGYDIGTVIILRDITQEKKDEKKIESLNRARDKFYSIISHDLRTPFATISSYNELIKFQVEKGEYSKVKEYSALIGQTVDQSERLLNNLLDWTKTQTGDLPFKPDFYDLNSIIDNILELYELIAMQKNIEFKKSIDKVKGVYLDKNLISTVLRNLISNAIKYTSPEGSISLSTYRQNGYVLISVKDTGVGMTEDQLSTLFTPGEVVLRHGTDDEEGSGLGLLLSKEFVNMHNGNITVLSKVGEGTEFQISIPVK